MKRTLLAVLATIGLFSCTNTKNEAVETTEIAEITYMNFGDSTFNVDEAVSAAQLVEQLNGDSVWAVVGGPITKVCTTKGCWMATAINDDENLFVDYDYEFLLPTNSQGQEMVMYGYAYWDSTSVAQLRHYAEDEGASEEEIAAITEPIGQVKFKAKGVKIVVPTAHEE